MINNNLDNLLKLENKIRNLGMYFGKVKLVVTLEREFEGFSRRASEDMEERVTIEIVSPDEKTIKNVKVVGRTYETINEVAKKVVKELNL